MPTTTDRAKIKKAQKGSYLTAGSSGDNVSDMSGAVNAMHARPYATHRKAGSENAATNVAALPFGTVFHKAKAKAFAIQVVTNIAADNTNYAVIHFYGRYNGTSTTLGSWNTHGGAQGALTTAGPAIISTAATGLVTNADGTVVAFSGLTYDIQKVSAGQDVAAGAIFSAWLEEV